MKIGDNVLVKSKYTNKTHIGEITTYNLKRGEFLVFIPKCHHSEWYKPEEIKDMEKEAL